MGASVFERPAQPLQDILRALPQMVRGTFRALLGANQFLPGHRARLAQGFLEQSREALRRRLLTIQGKG